jgi:hypothetical protein
MQGVWYFSVTVTESARAPRVLLTPVPINGDLVEGDLVERDLEVPGATFTRTLGAYFKVQPDAELGRALRISDDAEGTKVWLTPTERVAELEAELARRG